MLPATISFDDKDSSPSQPVSGTVVDISTGCLAVRIPLTEAEAEVMRSLGEGDFVEAKVTQSAEKHWTVLGHVVWLWIPTMEGDDTIGSVGVDIAGVIEEDQSVLGKLRGILGERSIDVDRTNRRVETPAQRRERERQERTAEPLSNDEPRRSDSSDPEA